MRRTLPCPVCMHALTFVATPGNLACPFCQAAIRFPNDEIPVGERVTCERCQGTFTAEEPPTGFRVFAAAPVPCPQCGVVLGVRADLPAGKKVKCSACGAKFHPTLPLANVPPAVPTDVSQAAATPRKSTSKTQLSPRLPTGETKNTKLAPEPIKDGAAGVPLPPPLAPRPLSEEEIDLLASDPEEDLQLPGRPPPRPRSKPVAKAPEPVPVDDVRLRPDPAPPRVPTTPDGNKRMPALQPAHTAASGNGAAVPEPGPAPKTPRMPQRKKKPIDKPPVEPPALDVTEFEVGDVAIVDEPIAATSTFDAEPLTESATPAASDKPKPLSFQSLERDAMSALLDPAEAVEPAASAIEHSVEPDALPQPQPRPIMPAPAPMPLRRAPASPSRGVSIDVKKWATYGGMAAALALLIFGVSYWWRNQGLGKLTVYETKGIVLFQGQPAEGARVTLHPEVNKRHRYYPTGKVGKDGSFTLTTYKADDGAPAGKYKVTIVRGHLEADEYQELSKTKTPAEMTALSQQMANDPLYSAYADPSKSNLGAEIVAGKANRLEFKLD